MIIIREFPDIKPVNEKSFKSLMKNKSFSFERKHDGTAAMCFINKNEIKILGRGVLQDGSISDYTNTFPEIVQALKKLNLNKTELLGEICIFDGEKYESFNLLQRRTTRKTNIDEYAQKYPARLMLFDILFNFKKDFINEPYKERRKILSNLMTNTGFENSPYIGIIPRKKKLISKRKLWDVVEKNKLEGIVIKDENSPFYSGLYKYKITETEDVFVGGYKPGTGRLKRLGFIGSLKIFQFMDWGIGTNPVCVGNVGSGLNDESREILTKMLKNNEPIVIEVKYDSVTKKGKFRHPRFLRIRTDKGVNQCVRKVPK